MIYGPCIGSWQEKENINYCVIGYQGLINCKRITLSVKADFCQYWLLTKRNRFFIKYYKCFSRLQEKHSCHRRRHHPHQDISNRHVSNTCSFFPKILWDVWIRLGKECKRQSDNSSVSNFCISVAKFKGLHPILTHGSRNSHRHCEGHIPVTGIDLLTL